MNRLTSDLTVYFVDFYLINITSGESALTLFPRKEADHCPRWKGHFVEGITKALRYQHYSAEGGGVVPLLIHELRDDLFVAILYHEFFYRMQMPYWCGILLRTRDRE